MIPLAAGTGFASWLPFVLVFARVLPLGAALIVFTRGWIPSAVAISLCLALSCALTPLAGEAPTWVSVGALALWLLRELCIGGAFALALSLALIASGWAVRLSQGPESRLAVAQLSQSYVLYACWLALSLGAQRAVLIGLAESFRDAPLAGTTLGVRAFALGSAQLVADALVTAIGVALPLLVSVWLIELTCSLIVRVLAPGALATTALQPVLRPLVLLAALALLLGPVAGQAPDAVRAAIVAARTLTRALAR
jgi:flagellar biosynthesis protein FliR